MTSQGPQLQRDGPSRGRTPLPPCVTLRIVIVGGGVAGLTLATRRGKRSVAAAWRGSASSTVATVGRYCARKTTQPRRFADDCRRRARYAHLQFEAPTRARTCVSFINIAKGTPMKSSLDTLFKHVASAATRVRNSLARMRRERAKRGLLTDDIANGSSNTYAIDRWHVLGAALIVG